MLGLKLRQETKVNPKTTMTVVSVSLLRAFKQHALQQIRGLEDSMLMCDVWCCWMPCLQSSHSCCWTPSSADKGNMRTLFLEVCCAEEARIVLGGAG